VSENNVTDQVRKLIKLQQGDTEVYSFKKELEEKPFLIKELQAQFEQKKTKLNQLEADYKKVQLGRKTLEGDLAQKEEDIKKAESQLSYIKTNKEYTEKIGEIEGLKADKSIIEEKILESYDEADEMKKAVEAERQVVAKQEEEFLAGKKEIEAQAQALEAKIKEMTAGRDELLEGVDKAILAKYERILDNRDGLAVVPVSGGVCGGCFMNIPPQVINEIRKHKELMCCERCTRILYLEEYL